MDAGTITNLVSTVGFPILCCVVMFYYINKRDEKEATRDELHAQETESLRKTLESNTLVLQKLTDKLDAVLVQGGETGVD